MWNDLNMAQKSELMKIYIQNGIYNLDQIRKDYDSKHQSGDEATLPNYSENVYQEGGLLNRRKVYNRLPADASRYIWGNGLMNSMKAGLDYLFNGDSYVENALELPEKQIHWNDEEWKEYYTKLKSRGMDVGQFDDFKSIMLNKANNLIGLEDAKDIYLGMPQRNSTFISTNETPSMGKLSNPHYSRYVSSRPIIEKYILPAVKNIRLNNVNGDYKNAGDLYTIGKSRTNGVTELPVLGNATVGYGVDPHKGPYVSYYDKWDVNMGGKSNGSDFVHKVIGGKPFDVYDRIYLDDYYGIDSVGDYLEAKKQDPELTYSGYLPELTVYPKANSYQRGGRFNVKNAVESIYDATKRDEYLGKPWHGYRVIKPEYEGKTEEELDKLVGPKDPITGHRSDIVKSELHPSHLSRGHWNGNDFMLTDKGLNDVNYTYFGLYDGNQDRNARLIYDNSTVLPEITVMPDSTFIHNSYDNENLHLKATGGHLYQNAGFLNTANAYNMQQPQYHSGIQPAMNMMSSFKPDTTNVAIANDLAYEKELRAEEERQRRMAPIDFNAFRSNFNKYGNKRKADINMLSKVDKYLISKGVPLIQRQAIVFAIQQEGSTFNDHGNGAFGLVGWRGDRKKNLTADLNKQLDYLYNGLYGKWNVDNWTASTQKRGMALQKGFQEAQTLEDAMKYLNSYVRPPQSEMNYRVGNIGKMFAPLPDVAANGYQRGGQLDKKLENSSFVSELDWSPESWFSKRVAKPDGTYYNANEAARLASHVPEYYNIEQTSKQNGTWLKMADGSTWEGDPRAWVMMQSQAYRRNYSPKPWYTGQAEWPTQFDYPKDKKGAIKTNKVTRAPYYNGQMWFSNDKTYGDAFSYYYASTGEGIRQRIPEEADVSGHTFLSAIPKKGIYRKLAAPKPGTADAWNSMPYFLRNGHIYREKQSNILSKTQNLRNGYVINARKDGKKVLTDDVVNWSRDLGDQGIFLHQVEDGEGIKFSGDVIDILKRYNKGRNRVKKSEFQLTYPILEEFISQPGFTDKVKFIEGNTGDFDINNPYKYAENVLDNDSSQDTVHYAALGGKLGKVTPYANGGHIYQGNNPNGQKMSYREQYLNSFPEGYFLDKYNEFRQNQKEKKPDNVVEYFNPDIVAENNTMGLNLWAALAGARQIPAIWNGVKSAFPKVMDAASRPISTVVSNFTRTTPYWATTADKALWSGLGTYGAGNAAYRFGKGELPWYEAVPEFALNAMMMGEGRTAFNTIGKRASNMVSNIGNGLQSIQRRSITNVPMIFPKAITSDLFNMFNSGLKRTKYKDLLEEGKALKSLTRDGSKEDVLKRLNYIYKSYNIKPIPSNVAKLSDKEFLEYITKELEKQNTYVRGVRLNPEDYLLPEKEQLEKYKYYATHYAGDTGHGRAGVTMNDNTPSTQLDYGGEGTIYLSNSYDQADAYALSSLRNIKDGVKSDGKIVKVRMPLTPYKGDMYQYIYDNLPLPTNLSDWATRSQDILLPNKYAPSIINGMYDIDNYGKRFDVLINDPSYKEAFEKGILGPHEEYKKYKKYKSIIDYDNDLIRRGRGHNLSLQHTILRGPIGDDSGLEVIDMLDPSIFNIFRTRYHTGRIGKDLSNFAQGGQLGYITPYGQWQYPHQVTTIPSNNITMQGVDYPVVGVSDTGDTKVMLPGLDYLYDGNYVTEYPVQ